MFALTSYPAVDVLIGLAFLYFLLSIICSAINEGIMTALNQRAKDLEAGIRQMLEGEPTKSTLTPVQQFYGNPRVQTLFKPKRFLGWIPGLRDKKPSYIPSRIFALTILDTVAPSDGGKVGENRDVVALAQTFVEAREKKTAHPRLWKMVEEALTEAQGNRDKFQESLERQFDEVMQRVSGWYKRRTQLILFGIALVLVGAINADSFAIGQRLWKDDALRSAVVAQADATVKNGSAKCAESGTAVEKAGKCLDEVQQLQVPLGWSQDTSPKNIAADAGKAAGLLLTAFALLLGAPFWFDTLSKLAQLRGTGRASANPSTPEGATTTKTA
jgi:hypothetical protein